MKFSYLYFFPIFFLTTCRFIHFYPDPDDPGLSRLTAHGYGVASHYIQDQAYTNMNSDTLLYKIETNSAFDTLVFSWPLRASGDLPKPVLYKRISFLLPVPKQFSKQSLYNMQGERLTHVRMELQDTLLNIHQGMGSINFAVIRQKPNGGTQLNMNLAGVFEGLADGAVKVSKGRFDWSENEAKLNF